MKVDLVEQPDIAALKRGDEKEVRRLWQRIREPSLRTAYYYCGNWDDAQDILQISLIKALEKLDSFQNSGDFYAWFRRILIHACIDWRRSAYRRLRLWVEDKQLNNMPETRAAPDSDYQQVLQRLIPKLPGKMRIIFILRDVEQMAVGEIAAALDLTENAVRVNSMRARQKIRTWLEEKR